MRYDAGVEDFLSMVKYASYVVTNSYHGFLFAVQYHKQVKVFLREQANIKISEVCDLLGLSDCICGDEIYSNVPYRLEYLRKESFDFLDMSLRLL